MIPPRSPLSAQSDALAGALARLERAESQDAAEMIIRETFAGVPAAVLPDSGSYYAVLNAHLYRFILKCYRGEADHICCWRFIKRLAPDQLEHRIATNPDLRAFDILTRIFFFSAPLDDLTCLFIPISDDPLIPRYLEWIKRYFYDVSYPTSLLWLYALDSSLVRLFPDEITYLGRRLDPKGETIISPDFNDTDAVLIKRFSEAPGRFIALEGPDATNEFHLLFSFLEREHQDRCLCRSGKKNADGIVDPNEWEKFTDVLKFGVSDQTESGCISFSDMRASTEFLNAHGKLFYLNKIQQPFFEGTELISKRFGGRIDKFMGDNVMCVFLSSNRPSVQTHLDSARDAVLSIIFAVFALCRMLNRLMRESGIRESRLGLRSGVTFGDQILRSNLGNEIVRDFTVTGETVNLAARLEHISVPELLEHNRRYFQKAIDRFPHIRDLIAIKGNYENLNPETQSVIHEFTLFQNIVSNLDRLSAVQFDIRMNRACYEILRAHLADRGIRPLNADTAGTFGYEEYEIEGVRLKCYCFFYTPKGFTGYETIWILPLAPETLDGLEIERVQ